jgi:hypothetical protein
MIENRYKYSEQPLITVSKVMKPVWLLRALKPFEYKLGARYNNNNINNDKNNFVVTETKPSTRQPDPSTSHPHNLAS